MMDKSREELEKEYAEATAKLEQYQHRGQRYENRIRYYAQGERKKRNHRLITRGGAVESIAPEMRGMSERAFFPKIPYQLYICYTYVSRCLAQRVQ